MNCFLIFQQEKQRENYDFVLKENAELKKLLHKKREAHASYMLKMKQVIISCNISVPETNPND